MVNPLNDTNAKAKQLAIIKELIRDIPEVNKARVVFLKGEIANQRYQISSVQIAAKMIADIECTARRFW